MSQPTAMTPNAWASSATEPGTAATDRLYVRSQLFQARIKAHDVVQEHLKQIITVASATLALTLTFLKDVLGNVGDKLLCKYLLPASWLLLGACILVSVLTLAALVNNLDSAGDLPERAFQAGGKPMVQRSILLSFLTFGLGMLFLGSFAAANFERLLRFQKENYKVGSAVVALDTARGQVPPGMRVVEVSKIELIAGIAGATESLPVWHVQLQLAPALVSSATPPKTGTGRSAKAVALSASAATQSVDYLVDASSARVASQ